MVDSLLYRQEYLPLYISLLLASAQPCLNISLPKCVHIPQSPWHWSVNCPAPLPPSVHVVMAVQKVPGIHLTLSTSYPGKPRQDQKGYKIIQIKSPPLMFLHDILSQSNTMTVPISSCPGCQYPSSRSWPPGPLPGPTQVLQPLVDVPLGPGHIPPVGVL